MATARRGKKKRASTARKARLYHLTEYTIKQIEILAALYGGKEAAVAGAVDATYQAAGVALRRLKVRVR